MRKLVFLLVVISLNLIAVPVEAQTFSGSYINISTSTQLDPPTNNFVCRGATATLSLKTGSIAYLSSFDITVENSQSQTLRYASTTASSSTSTLSVNWNICSFDLYYQGTGATYYLIVEFYDAGGLGRSETLQIPVTFTQARTAEAVHEELQTACADLSGYDINWQLDMSNKAKLPKTKLTIRGKVYRSAFLVRNTQIRIRTKPEILGGKTIASQNIGNNGKINITFDSKKSKYGIYYLVLSPRNEAIRGYLPYNGWAGEEIQMILGQKNRYLILPKVKRDPVPSISSECESLMEEYASLP